MPIGCLYIFFGKNIYSGFLWGTAFLQFFLLIAFLLSGGSPGFLFTLLLVKSVHLKCPKSGSLLAGQSLPHRVCLLDQALAAD